MEKKMAEHANRSRDEPIIPVIDLAKDKIQVIGKIRDASEKWGFFQIVNHGIPENVMERMIHSTRLFHEQDDEVKKQYSSQRVAYNPKLYGNSSWKDTLFAVAPDPPKLEEYPDICRDIMVEYAECVKKLGKSLLGLLSEALGLMNPNHLYEMGCGGALIFQHHCYKACPEAEAETLGLLGHTDSCILTILLQDKIGGLQVLHANQWIDVPYVPGALIINIGDTLQIFSNDKLKSVFHRVLAKSNGPRVSVGGFFQVRDEDQKIYEPIHELVSDENPAVFGPISLRDLRSQRLISQGSGQQISVLEHFKLKRSALA